MIIKDKFQVTDPVDGKDIIKLITPRRNPEGETTYKKAFQVAKHIWVVPERYYIEELDVLDKNKIDQGIYDSSFMKSDEEKQDFLNAIVILLKRLNSVPQGAEFLTLLSSSLPLPRVNADFTAYKFDESLMGLDEDNMPTNKFFGANIVIYGPGANLTETKVYELSDENSHSGMGSTCEIAFNPFHVHQYGDFLEDPVLAFIKGLLKAMYRLYGITPPVDLKLPYKQNVANQMLSMVTLEEILINGPEDSLAAFQQGVWLDTTYFEEADKYYTASKQSFQDMVERGALDSPLKEYLEQKFSVSINDLWNISLSKLKQNLGIFAPPSFTASLSAWERNAIYKLNYPQTYNESGFTKGQNIHHYLDLGKIEIVENVVDLPIQKITLADTNFTVLNYDDKLQHQDDYYNDYRVDDGQEGGFNVQSPERVHLLVDTQKIEELAPLTLTLQQIDDWFVPTHLVPDVPQAKETVSIEVENPLPLHYLKAQEIRTEKNDFVTKYVTNNFTTAVKNDHFSYTFLFRFYQFLSENPFEMLQSETDYYNWLKKLSNAFYWDIIDTHQTKVESLSYYIPWISQAINIANNEDGIEETLRKEGAFAFIQKANWESPSLGYHPSLTDDDKPLSYEEIKTKLSTYYEKGQRFLNALHQFTVQQFWVKEYSQFVQLFYFVRRALAHQQSLYLTLINNALLYMSGEGVLTPTQIERMGEQVTLQTNRTAKWMQSSLENVNHFLEDLVLLAYKENFYLQYLKTAEEVGKSMNQSLTTYLSKNGNLLSDEEKEQVIAQFQFTDIDYESCLNEQMLRDFIDFKYQAPFSLEGQETELCHLIAQSVPNQEDNVDSISDQTYNSESIHYSISSKFPEGRTLSPVIPLDSQWGAIEVQNKKLSFDLLQSFSISFWIRHIEGELTTALLKCGSEEFYWQVGFVDGYLTFDMQDILGNHQSIISFQSLNSGWRKVDISVNRILNQVILYIDGKAVGSEDLANINCLGALNLLMIQVTGDVKLELDELKIDSVDFSQLDIYERYQSDFSDEFLRDKNGMPLFFNQPYLLSNKVNPLQKVTVLEGSFLGIQENEKQTVSLKFQILEDNKKTIIESSDVFIIELVQEETEKYLTIQTDGMIVLTEDRSQATIWTSALFSYPNSFTYLCFKNMNNYYIKLSPKQNNQNMLEVVNPEYIDRELKNVFYWNLEKEENRNGNN